MSKTIDNTNLGYLVQLIKNYIISKVSEHVKDVSINGTTITVTHDDDTTETLTTQDTVTTATTSGSGNAVTAVTASNGQLTVTKGNSFLPTSGGTMDGAITTSVQQIIKKNDNTSSVQLLGGTSSDDGAYLRLEGQTGSYTGNFRIVANDSSSGTRVSAVLQGTPAGSLTWKGNELAAQSWVQGLGYAVDSAVVHLAGTEKITGSKTFGSDMNRSYATFERGTTPSSNGYAGYRMVDKNGNQLGGAQHRILTSGTSQTRVYAYKNDSSDSFAAIGVNFPSSGDAYGYAPSTPSGSTGTEIVTADFVTNLVQTPVPENALFTDTVTTATTSGSGNVVTAVSASNGALTVTKGSTAVLTSGNQTVAGTKTFSASPVVPTATAGDSSTKAASTAFVANAVSTADASVVHTTGAETVGGIKTFSDDIKLDDGKGIWLSNNGVTSRQIGTVLESVEGNNGLNLRLGYGGTVYITGGECATQITAENGFAYGAENVQLMADSSIVFRAGLNSGFVEGQGAIVNASIFRPLTTGGMDLGSSTYKWGNVYSTGFIGDLTGTASKATADADGNTISTTYAKDANVMHLSGNETCTGVKTHNGEIVMKYTTVVKGEAPTSNRYMSYKWADNSGDVISAVQSYIDKTTGNNRVRLVVYRNDASSTDFGAMGLIQPTIGDPYGYAPSTPSGSTGNQIVTADFLNTTVGSYLPKSGGEVTGSITSSIENTLTASRATGNVWAASAERTDKSNKIAFGIGSAGVNRGIYDTATSKWIVYCDGTNACTQLGVTATSDDSASHIATTGWTKDVLAGYLTGVTATTSGSGNAVTAITASGGALTVTKGSTFLTSHQSLDGCVKTTGAETIDGVKTFSSVPEVKASSPSIKLINTGITKGTAPSANNNKYVFAVMDSAGTGYLSCIYKTISKGNVTSTRLYDYGNSASGTTNLGEYIGIGHNADGTAYTYAPTPDTSDNSTNIATTAYVTDKLGTYATQTWVEDKGYLTEHQSIAGKMNVSGSRGNLAGYQTPLDVTANTSITYSSRDIIRVNASSVVITVANSSSSAAWVKYVHFAEAGTMNLGSSWDWIGYDNGNPIAKNDLIILIWCKNHGWALVCRSGAKWDYQT